METTPLTISSLSQLLDQDISRMMSTELLLKNSISGWVSNKNSAALKLLMHDYLDVAEKHIRQLDLFFGKKNTESSDPENRIMQAYIKEADERLSGCTRPEIKDACMSAIVQSIAHLKISLYGTAAAFAAATGLQAAGLLFHQAAQDEKEMDERLSYLAEHELNRKASIPIEEKILD
jgi:ferritin-like metal-binding protein YciE